MARARGDYLVKKIGADETFNVTLELVKHGYTEEQIGKIWSGNLLRVMDEVQQGQADPGGPVTTATLSPQLREAPTAPDR